MMAQGQYRVLADRFGPGKQGEIVELPNFTDAQVQALMEGGVLEVAEEEPEERPADESLGLDEEDHEASEADENEEY